MIVNEEKVDRDEAVGEEAGVWSEKGNTGGQNAVWVVGKIALDETTNDTRNS